MTRLGLSLTEARLARGLTLDDAERGTRIAKRFLIALEEHDYSVFPAPVYARGFLRTYCRFLDVDPEPQLAELPLAWAASAPQPMARVSRPIDFNLPWLAGGAIAAVLAVAVALFLFGNGSVGDVSPSSPTSAVAGPQGDPRAVANEAGSSFTPRPLERTVDASLPDFTAVDVEEVLDYLTDQILGYLVIETANQEFPAGYVIDQLPDPGLLLARGHIVYLLVSVGPEGADTNREDCKAIAADTHRTVGEHYWFDENCLTGAQVQPSAQLPPQQLVSLPDRTNCDAIRGTDYRSAAERAFFLSNCIVR